VERIRDDEAYEGVRGRVEARLGDVRVPPQIDVLPISVPSLRERVDDIPLLVEYFVGRFAKEAGKSIRRIGKDTLAATGLPLAWKHSRITERRGTCCHP
jgi:hypothetical protein